MPLTHRPQLLALDLDGTVVDEHNAIPAETLAALHACHAAGIELAFITGRRPRTARSLLDSIGLPCYVGTNTGCLLWGYPGWYLLERQLFPVELIPRIAELTAPYTVNFYLDTSQSEYEFIQLERETTPEAAAHMQHYGWRTLIVHDAREIQAHPVTQVALPAQAAITERLRDQVRAALDGQVHALSVRWPLLPAVALEIFGSGATKGRALESIARRLGIARENCLAAGDDVNDIAMLQWAGYSVAMPQANADVRAVVCETLSGNGARALAPLLAALPGLPPRP